MISLETSRKLKDAGLVWEPKEGDAVYKSKKEIATLCQSCAMVHFDTFDAYLKRWKLNFDANKKWYFAPRLDQLLAEIERQGYVWDASLNPAQDQKYACWVVNKDVHYCAWGNFPDEAAAAALLWIMGQQEPFTPSCYTDSAY